MSLGTDQQQTSEPRCSSASSLGGCLVSKSTSSTIAAATIINNKSESEKLIMQMVTDGCLLQPKKV
jgi:hypothetical protein